MFQFPGLTHIAVQLPMVARLPHSEIYVYNTYLQFNIAYRSLSRPSSSLEA